MKAHYKATLTGNRRDTATSSPKILIVHIDPESALGRNHCWVDATAELSAIQPAGHKPAIRVSFDADIEPYLKQGTIQQYRFTNITNIQRIK